MKKTVKERINELSRQVPFKDYKDIELLKESTNPEDLEELISCYKSEIHVYTEGLYYAKDKDEYNNFIEYLRDSENSLKVAKEALTEGKSWNYINNK